MEHLRNQAESLDAAESGSAAIAKNSTITESCHASGHYRVECRDAAGNLKWADDIDNIVTTVGGNNMLDNHLSGSAYTAAWYVGLISATSYVSVPVLADTSASHATWAEDQNYSQGTRPTAAFSSAASKSKSLSGSGATFSMNAIATIKGCFLISVSTKGGTTGTLFSAGLFTGGDKTVGNGDTLNVSYAATV